MCPRRFTRLILVLGPSPWPLCSVNLQTLQQLVPNVFFHKAVMSIKSMGIKHFVKHKSYTISCSYYYLLSFYVKSSPTLGVSDKGTRALIWSFKPEMHGSRYSLDLDIHWVLCTRHNNQKHVFKKLTIQKGRWTNEVAIQCPVVITGMN